MCRATLQDEWCYFDRRAAPGATELRKQSPEWKSLRVCRRLDADRTYHTRTTRKPERLLRCDGVLLLRYALRQLDARLVQ